MNIYVGNLAFDLTEGQLRTVFEAHGTVESARIITDRDTGRPRGFGFVEMPNSREAETAIQATNGQMLEGRELKVNEARPKEDRGGGGGGGGRRGGSGGGYGGGSGGGGGRGRY